MSRVIGRKHRRTFLDIERQINEMVNTVDAWCALLGPRHWIFHEELSMDDAKALAASAESPEQAEEQLIRLYQDGDTLRFYVGRLNRHQALRDRRAMLELALADYQAGRYAATTLILLTVMDGFVNDFESIRRGLHARDAEDLNAWDSMVSHHQGLAATQSLFTKSTGATNCEPLYELQRNGIIHGTRPNFDNVIVATKAWNRLFAVANWADARISQAKPEEPQPSLRESLKVIAETGRRNKALAAWEPYVSTPENGLVDDEAARSLKQYLEAWKGRRYDVMSSLVANQRNKAGGKHMARVLNQDYRAHALESFEVIEIHHVAAAICEAHVGVAVAGERYDVWVRLSREGMDGGTGFPGEPGAWRVMFWGYDALVVRTEPARRVGDEP